MDWRKKIIVAGIGGAGCRIIDWLNQNLDDPPKLAAVDLDASALSACRATTKLQIGSDSEGGFGSGGDPNIAKQAVEEDVEMIRGLFTDAAVLIMCAGLGGGTGSGISKTILNVAAESNILTICMFSTPFKFEGENKAEIAERALDEIGESADIIVTFCNERLIESTGEEKIAGAFAKADEIIGMGVLSLWSMLTKPGFVRVDISHLRKLSEETEGRCLFAFARGKGNDRIKIITDTLLHGSMTTGGKIITEANAMLLLISGGNDLTIKEISDLTDAIKSARKEGCKIHVGTIVDDKLNGEICVTLLVTDFANDRAAHNKKLPRESKSFFTQKKPKQTHLMFPSEKDRFQDSTPTIMYGEDLDIPTYIRRHIKLIKSE